MSNNKDSGHVTGQDDLVELLDLVKKNGYVPFPKDFAKDGNALALVSTTTTALKKAGWPKEDVARFKEIALEGDYHRVINCCLTTFER